MVSTEFDLITMGRVSVDLYPDVSGISLDRVERFRRFLGGSATNVAVAAARYGHKAAVVTKVGDDPFGTYVRTALHDFGVDPRFVGTHPELRTPIVFCELHPPDHFPLLFYREPQAPDMTITGDELDHAALASARIVWTTGTGLSAEPSRTATLAALSSAQGSRIHDLDYRPTLWADPTQNSRLQRDALELASVAIGNREECAAVVGDGPTDEIARRLLGLGVDLVVIKMGPAGVSAYTEGERVHLDPIPVDVVNGLGAGDAFGGALCHGLLSGWTLPETIDFANAAGAYVATQLACADAMPDEETVRSLKREWERT